MARKGMTRRNFIKTTGFAVAGTAFACAGRFPGRAWAAKGNVIVGMTQERSTSTRCSMSTLARKRYLRHACSTPLGHQ
jgi:hypothetical protein